jgi:DNA polymerase I-like protein with 3'-5' exonuclease and polymerase domains
MFIVHNCTQSVARIVMSDGMLRVDKRYPTVLTVHDELGALIPEAEAETGLAWILKQMTREPKYMPGIPLAADGGFAKRYGDAKQ